jgi:hypothetical protein
MRNWLIAAITAVTAWTLLLAPALAAEKKMPSDTVPIITFTFDDGLESPINNAVPILRKYGFPATFFITTQNIGEPLDEIIWKSLNWKQIRKLFEDGNEIGAHTITHRDLSEVNKLKADNTGPSIAEELFVPSELIYQYVGVYPTAFATPKGEDDPEITHMIRTMARDDGKEPIYESQALDWGKTWYGVNGLRGVDPYKISRISITKDITPRQVCQWVSDAINYDHWLVFMFHNVLDIPEQIQNGEDQSDNAKLWKFVVTPANFKAMVEKCIVKPVSEGKIKILTISQALAEINRNPGQ